MRELSRFGKNAVKMIGNNGTTWGDITKERRNTNRGVERGLRGAKENVWREENIISGDP